MTYPEDKIPALSGIAKWMGRYGLGDYLAGMRGDNIELQLAWSVAEPEPRPTNYRAPSWSWMSVDGITSPFVNYYGLSRRSNLVQAVDVSIELVPDDMFGQVKGEMMRLWCRKMKRTTIPAPSAIFGGYVGIWYVTSDEEQDGENFYLPTLEHSGCIDGGLILKPTGEKYGDYRPVGYLQSTCPLDAYNVASKEDATECDYSECSEEEIGIFSRSDHFINII